MHALAVFAMFRAWLTVRPSPAYIASRPWDDEGLVTGFEALNGLPGASLLGFDFVLCVIATGNALAGVTGNTLDFNECGIPLRRVDVGKALAWIGIVLLEQLDRCPVHALARLGIEEQLSTSEAVHFSSFSDGEVSTHHHNVAPIHKHHMKHVHFTYVLVRCVGHHFLTGLELIHRFGTVTDGRQLKVQLKRNAMVSRHKRSHQLTMFLHVRDDGSPSGCVRSGRGVVQAVKLVHGIERGLDGRTALSGVGLRSRNGEMELALTLGDFALVEGFDQVRRGCLLVIPITSDNASSSEAANRRRVERQSSKQSRVSILVALRQGDALLVRTRWEAVVIRTLAPLSTVVRDADVFRFILQFAD